MAHATPPFQSMMPTTTSLAGESLQFHVLLLQGVAVVVAGRMPTIRYIANCVIRKSCFDLEIMVAIAIDNIRSEPAWVRSLDGSL